ncbi:MAG: hypothetical protein JO348_05275 [Alphaproteobacteria bacterium]|nr:hypothetical protein [Alphaproteobacteria bacterium]MBV9419165.1 hypothetical protein [Alphaproteobacteria bacterium]MBV9541187.1 hypothetical protein [Alphaproteobacteria bacterium]MBV9903221.1 hypothetical protein [Alphaproteobacteria bacterium]
MTPPGHSATPPINATAGSGGTAAVNGTSASTLGVAATSGSNSAMGVGASAAGGTNNHTGAAVHGNNVLNGQARAMANDHGTFSHSHTHCQAKPNQDPTCRTKTMSHVPGSRPTMSTTTSP